LIPKRRYKLKLCVGNIDGPERFDKLDPKFGNADMMRGACIYSLEQTLCRSHPIIGAKSVVNLAQSTRAPKIEAGNEFIYLRKFMI